MSMWVAPLKNVPNLLCQTVYSTVGIDSCSGSSGIPGDVWWARALLQWSVDVCFKNQRAKFDIMGQLQLVFCKTTLQYYLELALVPSPNWRPSSNCRISETALCQVHINMSNVVFFTQTLVKYELWYNVSHPALQSVLTFLITPWLVPKPVSLQEGVRPLKQPSLWILLLPPMVQSKWGYLVIGVNVCVNDCLLFHVSSVMNWHLVHGVPCCSPHDTWDRLPPPSNLAKDKRLPITIEWIWTSFNMIHPPHQTLRSIGDGKGEWSLPEPFLKSLQGFRYVVDLKCLKQRKQLLSQKYFYIRLWWKGM